MGCLRFNIMNAHAEVEIRFLDIDKEALIEKLRVLGAEDKGEQMLRQTIFYNLAENWRENNRFVRLRSDANGIEMTYKSHTKAGNTEGDLLSVIDISTPISDMEKMEVLLEHVGLTAYRHEEKKRHTFILDDVTIDIDSWPQIPAYVELEADSEEVLRTVAEKLGFSWDDIFWDNAAKVMEKYGIDVLNKRYFTFDRIE